MATPAIVEPAGWKSADSRAFEDAHDQMLIYRSCEGYALHCPHWPKSTLHRLENDVKFRRWHYVSVCCGIRKRYPGERARDLFNALRHREVVVAILTARGVLQFPLGFGLSRFSE